MLTTLGRRLADAASAELVVARVADAVDVLLAPDDLLIVLVTPTGGRAVAHTRGSSSRAPDHPLVDLAFAEGPTLIARDVRDALGGSQGPGRLPASWLGTPLVASTPLGAISVGASQPDRFGEADLQILVAIAGQAALALERVRLLGAVSRGKVEWEQTVDALGQAFCVVDAGGRALRANRPFSDLADVPLTAIPGQPVIGLVPPTWAAAVSTLITHPGSGKTTEVRTRERVFTLAVYPLRQVGDGCAVLVLDDQTEKRRLQEQLVQSEKMSAIGQLIAGVAHDLNNPLASVIGFADYLLEQRDLAPPELLEPLRAIQQEADRAAAIVRNLLSFARKQEGRRRTVPIRHILEATHVLLRNQLMAGKIEATLDIAPDLPDVTVDTNQLQQVFLNLINNAAQAILAGGTGERITIRAHPWLEGVAVTVEDDGPGVPEHLRERVFEPFFTTKPEGEGTGLGLSICQGIVKEHGGRITLAEVAGGGSAFRVELPGAREARRETGELPAVPAGLRVLVVDDEPHIRHYLQATLEAWGHETRLAADGRDALAQVGADRFDVVITDVRMPELGGREFYERLCRDDPTLARRVIFSTGDVVQGGTLAFLESLDRPWLRKPFTLNELRLALARTAAR